MTTAVAIQTNFDLARFRSIPALLRAHAAPKVVILSIVYSYRDRCRCPRVPTSSPVQLQIGQTTVFSLLGTVAVLAAAYTSFLRALSRYSGTKTRVLFFDALIHSIFEGSFLWNCLFVHAPYDSYSPSAFLPQRALLGSARPHVRRSVRNGAVFQAVAGIYQGR